MTGSLPVDAVSRNGRRGFIRALSRVCAVLLAGGTGVVAWRELRPVGFEPAPAGTSEHEAMAALGRLYLEVHPEDASPVALRKALGIEGIDGMFGSVRRRTVLAARIEEDVRRNDFVLLDGWMFTRSEARLFALAALPGS